MHPVSQAFLDAIVSYAQFVTDVAFSNDRGVTWEPLQLVSGTVTADRTSQTRWALSGAQFAVGTPTGLDGVNDYSTRIRVRRAVRVLRGTPEWVPLGVYRVSDVDTATDGSVQVEGASFEAAVADARLLTPRTIAGGQSARQVVEGIVAEAVPDAGFNWRVDGTDVLPTIHQDQDRWALIDGSNDDASIAKALGAEIYCNGTGAFVTAPTPTLFDDPVWTVGYGKALVQAQTKTSREGVYNVVVANGSSTDSSTAPAGPGIAWDDVPSSPTYAGPDPVNHPELAGTFGIVPRFYTSPLLRSLSACQVAARSLLADALGLHKAVTFDALANPALEPGDVVLVEVQPGRVEAHLLDTIAHDLAAGTISCQTRATTTRLLGLGDLLSGDPGGDIEVQAA